MADFDYTEARVALAGCLIATGLAHQPAMNLAYLQVQALANELLVTVPFYRRPPNDDDEQACRALVTAAIAEMGDATTGVLESIADPYPAIVVLTGMVGALIGHLAAAEGVPPVEVWQRACAAAADDEPTGGDR